MPHRPHPHPPANRRFGGPPCPWRHLTICDMRLDVRSGTSRDRQGRPTPATRPHVWCLTRGSNAAQHAQEAPSDATMLAFRERCGAGAAVLRACGRLGAHGSLARSPGPARLEVQGSETCATRDAKPITAGTHEHMWTRRTKHRQRKSALAWSSPDWRHTAPPPLPTSTLAPLQECIQMSVRSGRCFSSRNELAVRPRYAGSR